MATTTNASLAEYSGLAGDTGSKTAFTYVACGTGTGTEAAGDTVLGAEITDSGLARSTGTLTQRTTSQTDDTLRIVKAWSVTGTKTIAEVAMFNASSSGTMAWRDKLSSTKSVVSGDTFTFTAKTVFV